MTRPGHFGGRGSRAAATVEQRLAALEQAVRQVPSRFVLDREGEGHVHSVTQTDHGFTVGKYVARHVPDVGDPTFVLAESEGLPYPEASELAPLQRSPLFLVTRVVDEDRFEVIAEGYVRLPELGLTPWTPYFLASEGNTTATRPGDYVVMVHVALADGWLYVVGPAVADDHGHWLRELVDVTDPAEASDPPDETDGPQTTGEILAYNTGGEAFWSRSYAMRALGLGADNSVLGISYNNPLLPDQGFVKLIVSTAENQVLKRTASGIEWVDADLSVLGDIGALSVLGNPTNATAAAAEIAAGTDGHVLRRAGAALGFGQIVAAGIANGAVGSDQLAGDAVITAKILDANVTLAKLENLAGLSLLGRAANSAGVMAAITAGSDHHVLRRSGTSLGFGLVTTSNLDSPIGAGSAGAAASAPVITWDASGRLTAVTTAAITPAAIGAATAAHTHALDDLSDATITAVATRDFLRYNGTAWVNENLGPIGYTAGAGVADEAANVFYFGNASLGTLMNVTVANGSRFLIDAPSSIEFLVRGTVAATTDKWGKIAVVSNNVQFQDDGTEVMRWTCSATAASRKFGFMIDTEVTGTNNLTMVSTGKVRLCSGVAAISAGVSGAQPAFYHEMTYGGIGTRQLWQAEINGTPAFNVEWFATGAAPGTRDTMTLWGDLVVEASTGAMGDLVANFKGDVKLAGATKKLGCFGSAGTTKVTVADLGALATTETADATYNATEQSMLNNLKTDVTSLRTKVNALLDALQGYNLV